MKRPHFALPEIYDDSLSYYDVLRKLIKSMHVISDNLNKIPEQIANEAKARLLGDQNLQQNITAEASARETADNELRELISISSGGVTEAQLNEEITNRQNADNALQEKINTNKNDISELKSDLDNYKDDYLTFNFEQGFIRTTDGYIVVGYEKGIYTPNIIYLVKGSIINTVENMEVTFYRYNNGVYAGFSNSVEESAHYRIGITHIDGTNVDVNEGSNLIIDGKPRINKLENDVLDLDGNINDLSLELNQLQNFL